MKTINPEKSFVIHIANQFALRGEIVDAVPFGGGHINDTYLITMNDAGMQVRYIVQRINKVVFHHPDEVMENAMALTEFLEKKVAAEGGDVERELLHFVRTKDGGTCFCDEEDEYWRVTRFAEGTITYESATKELFADSGRTFGHFQYLLNGYPAETLYETIVNFHHTIRRFEDFEKAVQKDAKGRAASIREDIAFLLDRKAYAYKLLDLLEAGELPLRVTHNDTKLNNILFDAETKKAICVIDLDTVMPGLSAYDFGDSIRYGAITAAEDEPDLSKVHFDFELYEAFAKGFLEGCAGSLTEKEVEMLPYGALVITYEQALRFLGDYLDGDVYYKISHPTHNLDRARTQMKMVADMEEQWTRMQEVTKHGI